MNPHYLNTSLSNPQFYIFTQHFDLPTIDEIAIDLPSTWEIVQQTAWQNFWEFEGHNILEEKWYDNHPDYQELIGTASEDVKTTWQEKWEKFATDESEKYWHIFKCAFENYQNDLIRSLNLEETYAIEGEIPKLDSLKISEESVENNSTSNEIDSEEQLDNEQLILLGLPVAFGSVKSYRGKKRQVDLNLYRESNSEEDLEMDSDAILHGVKAPAIRKQRKKKKLDSRIPDFIINDNLMRKYWQRRFSLFSLFDQGIRLDRESWFSVTPEKIAKQTARRLACDVIVDGFCGCGGNAIQFALTCGLVIAVDIDADKLAMAKHNANIYGVAHKIEFIHADFFEFARSTTLRPDIVFLSPPWGGPSYLKKSTYDIEKCLQPVGATELMSRVRRLSDNIGCFFPRNANMRQVVQLALAGNQCEVEHNYLDTRLVAITAYYGQLIIGPSAENKEET